MKKIKILLQLVVFICLNSFAQTKDGRWLISAPAKYEFVEINYNGKSILPNGRFITPLGKNILTAPHPYGMVISPDEKTIVTANSGTSPLSISIIRNVMNENVLVQQVPPGASTDKGVLASVFMGLAISPDNKIVYVSGGETNNIYLFDLFTGNKIDSIDCSYKDADHNYLDGYIGDMVLSKDGKKIFAVDQINFRMIIADTKTKKLIRNIPVGRYPFGISLSPDEKNIFVANVGMYEYKKIQGITKKNPP